MLERLGVSLNQIYVDRDLGTSLGVDRIAPLLGNTATLWHGGASAGTGHGGSAGGISQLTMVPALPHFFNFSSPGEMHEEMYLHVLLMMSEAVNGRFQAKVKDVIAGIARAGSSSSGTADENAGTDAREAAPTVMAVAPKSFIRAMNKSIAKEDYRDKPKPRSANCVDTVRDIN